MKKEPKLPKRSLHHHSKLIREAKNLFSESVELTTERRIELAKDLLARMEKVLQVNPAAELENERDNVLWHVEKLSAKLEQLKRLARIA